VSKGWEANAIYKQYLSLSERMSAEMMSIIQSISDAPATRGKTIVPISGKIRGDPIFDIYREGFS